MGWLFVPGGGGLNSVSDSSLESPTGAFATSSGKPSQRPCSWPGWKTRPWSRLLSSMTFSPSTLNRGVEKWTSSLPGSPASPGPSPDSVREPTTSGGSGPRSLESFATWDPESCSWKTCQGSLFEAGLTQYSGTWPRSGSMRNGESFQPPESGLPTNESGFSFWRSPEGSDGEGGVMEIRSDTAGHYKLRDQASAWPTPNSTPGMNDLNVQKSGDGRKKPNKLGWAVGTWPTPKASDPKVAGNNLTTGNGMGLEKAARLWPTPIRPDSHPESPESRIKRRAHGQRDNLEGEARMWPTPNARDEKNPRSPDGPSAKRKADQGWTKDLNDASVTWSTPASRDYRHGQDLPNRHGKPSLPAQATRNGKDTKVLNPLFVEALMGWPTGWTSFESLGTEWSRWWRLMRSELLRLGPA